VWARNPAEIAALDGLPELAAYRAILAHLTTVDPTLVAVLDEAVVTAVVAARQVGRARDCAAPQHAVRGRAGAIR
jgi:hypothetical protein